MVMIKNKKNNFYEPGFLIWIKLSLRRTLQLQQICWTKFRKYKWVTQPAMPKEQKQVTKNY